MGSVNLDLVRSICAAWQRGDFSSADWAAPELEFVITGHGPADGRWKGLAAVAKGLGEYLSVFEEMRPEVEGYRELDAERVLVLSHPRGRGKTSGVDLGEIPVKGAQLFHLRDGKVTRIVHYGHRDRALAELGLTANAQVGQLAVAEDPEYALSSSSEEEHTRLLRQAEWYAPYTRRLFSRAGIASGMRVLDVGCGAGDVSFLAAEIVSPQGSVVGVERDQPALETARKRAVERAATNVEFVLGDFREVDGLGGPFDALVGRLVLMYQADPAAAIAAAARHVRPGGIVAFAEMCIGGPAMPGRATVGSPPTPAWHDSRALLALAPF